MTSMELLELLNNVSDRYVAEARTPVKIMLPMQEHLLRTSATSAVPC